MNLREELEKLDFLKRKKEQFSNNSGAKELLDTINKEISKTIKNIETLSKSKKL